MHRAMITDTPPREHEQMATSAKLMTADDLLLMRDDTLDGAPVFDGFSIRVSELFN